MKKTYSILCMAIFFIFAQFCGCGNETYSPEKMLEMIENEQEISVISTQSTQKQNGKKIKSEWKELGNREDYSYFREQFDAYYGIEPYEEYKKVGMIYTDFEGNHTLNSTLRNAFSNQYFIDCFYSEESNILTNILASDLYTDGYQNTRLAVLNGYFNIFPDFDNDSFFGNYQLSRGEFLAGIYLAEHPFSTLEENTEFKNAVNKQSNDTTTLFSAQMLDYSYFNAEDDSLNQTTYNEPITRAEAIYTLVRMYYNDEYETLTGTESISYTDGIKGENVALEQGFIEKNETTGELEPKKYWKSYELCYAVNYPETGMPEDLYKAMVIAERHHLMGDNNDETCRWNEPLTKETALLWLTNVYLDLGTVINVEYGYVEGYSNKKYGEVGEEHFALYNGTNEGKLIDIMDIPEEGYVFYDKLLEGADNDGIDDFLIEDRYFDAENPVPVMTIEGSVPRGNYRDMVQTVHNEVSEYVGILNKVYSAFLDDHLEVFWIISGFTTYRITSLENGNYTAEILLVLQRKDNNTGEIVMDARLDDYRSEERIKEDIAIRDARIAEILKAVEEKSDYEKLLYFNKELTMTNQYNTSSNVPPGGTHRSSIAGIKGSVGELGPVCAGYTKSFKVLCDAANIPCVNVGGYLRASSFGVYNEPHQWNYVKLEDNWYLVDVTWNDPYASNSGPVSGHEREDWCLLGSETIRHGQTVGSTRPLSPLLVYPPTLSKEAYQPPSTNP